MRTKDPTISDMYAFDAFITTPGVRDGLLESIGTNQNVFVESNDEGNEMVLYRTSWGEAVPIGKPLQLAAGPAQTQVDAAMPSDVSAADEQAYGQMKELTPTMRQRLAEFLQGGFEKLGADRVNARKRAQTLIGGPSSNLPLTLGLADIVPYLGSALQIEEGVHMAGEAAESAKGGNIGMAALQAGGAAVNMLPGVAPTVRATKAVRKQIKEAGTHQ